MPCFDGMHCADFSKPESNEGSFGVASCRKCRALATTSPYAPCACAYMRARTSRARTSRGVPDADTHCRGCAYGADGADDGDVSVHRPFNVVHYVKNGDRLDRKNTKKSLSDLCRRHRAKSLISIGNLHTRDQVAQRIMRNRMRWRRANAGLTRVGGRGPLGGGSATIYNEVHRRAILT